MAGSRKHKFADDLLTEYQYEFGNRGLETEVKYKNHYKQSTNISGGTRLDVYDTINNKVYDYKFVISKRKGKVLSKKQRNLIKRQGPRGLTDSKIIEINPK